jgi:hypothetical protein
MKEKMSVAEFCERFNFLPENDEDVASLVIRHHVDDLRVLTAAQLYLASAKEFRAALDAIGYEPG